MNKLYHFCEKNEGLINLAFIGLIFIVFLIFAITFNIKLNKFIKFYQIFNDDFLTELINVKEEFVAVFKDKYSLQSTDTVFFEYTNYNDNFEEDIENNLSETDNCSININDDFLKKPITNKKYYKNLKTTFSILLKSPEEQKILLNKYLNKINDKLGICEESKPKVE